MFLEKQMSILKDHVTLKTIYSPIHRSGWVIQLKYLNYILMHFLLLLIYDIHIVLVSKFMWCLCSPLDLK